MEKDQFYRDADWRSYAIVRVAATTEVPGLGILPAGVVGKVVGEVDYQSGRIAFTIPNATALFLNLAQKYYEEACSNASNFSVAPKLQSLQDNVIFAYLESIMASLAFAYTALEAFANEEIPDDLIYSIERNKFTEVYNKEQIERFLTLETKLGDILPKVFNVSSPKGTKAWQNYKTLETLRHSIIHMKKSDREHVGYSAESVWSKLIKESVPYSVPMAKAVINHFYESRSLKPHWYENIPF